jgi:hypothetical protein
MAGIARTIGSARTKKTAPTAALVTKVVKAISADTIAGLLDRALLLLQFAAAFAIIAITLLGLAQAAGAQQEPSVLVQLALGAQKSARALRRARPSTRLGGMGGLPQLTVVFDVAH